MIPTSNEYQLQFALQTFEKDLQLNIREATRLYNVLRTTLSIRINGISTRINTMVNLQKLTASKEKIVIQEIFDLDSQGFPLRIRDIENMVNRLLTIYDTTYIGLH